MTLSKKLLFSNKTIKQKLDEKFLEFAITLEVSKFINSPLNQPNTLEVLFNTLNHRIKLDLCALTFLRKDENELFITSTLNLTKKQRESVISKIKTFSKKFGKNETIVKNVEITNSSGSGKLKYLKNIPIVSSGETLCILSVGSSRGELKKKDLEFINILAKEFSLFLENDKDKQDLADEKNIIESIVQSMTEGVIFIDNSHKTIIINNAAKSMLEIKDHPCGKKIHSYMKNAELLNIVNAIGARLGNFIYKEITLEKPEGQRKKIIRCYASKTFDKDKKPLGITIVLTDITYEKQADETRIEFLSTASHELRTPLSAIKQSIELLKEDKKLFHNEEQAELLKIAHKNINRLSRLINDVLDITKIESGKMKFCFEKTNILKTIEECASTFNLVAKEKSINMVMKLDQTIPEVYIDKHRITQVIGNLLSNAIKFTPRGGKITIESGVYPLNKNYIEVSVKDTGAGIDKKDIPNLFKKFHQLSTQPEKAVKGTGLGLAITKDIIRLHNGHIWIESEPGSGSKFSFILPVERRKQDQIKKQILLIDSDKNFIDLVGDYLEKNNFDTFKTSSIKEAIKKTKTTVPDIIILDALAPNPDNYKVNDLLRKTSNSKVPIIMLTDLSKEKLKYPCSKNIVASNKIDALVEKENVKNELINTINLLLNLPR